MKKIILEVDNIQKYFGNKSNITKAIDNISFTVNEGEFVGIMGASGSGKTTLLNCISTIDKVTSGYILIEDEDITKINKRNIAEFRRKRLGFIFQDFNLLDTLTGYENISLALSINNVKADLLMKKVEEVAERLNIMEVLNKYPYQMSGGQQQRVAAARAIVTNPSIILADEPTGALDSQNSRMLLTMFEEMNNKMDATILMVTHDPLAASYCNRILFLKDGKIFNEIHKGDNDRKYFFNRILEVVSVLGGEQNEFI